MWWMFWFAYRLKDHFHASTDLWRQSKAYRDISQEFLLLIMPRLFYCSRAKPYLGFLLGRTLVGSSNFFLPKFCWVALSFLTKTLSLTTKGIPTSKTWFPNQSYLSCFSKSYTFLSRHSWLKKIFQSCKL
jgi:hypothetical protein